MLTQKYYTVNIYYNKQSKILLHLYKKNLNINTTINQKKKNFHTIFTTKQKLNIRILNYQISTLRKI